ncbi:MAG: hypothetical protein NVS9B6_18950 [Candidatus Limnocylindrales bacterium]
MRKVDLAAQLQKAEAALLERTLRPDPAAAPADVRIEQIDGIACFAVLAATTPYLNRALGFGTVTPATPQVLYRLITHYDALGRETRISTAAGYTPNAAIQLLEHAGFTQESEPGEVSYLRTGGRPPEPPSIPGLRLVRVRTAEDADTFADIADATFGRTRRSGYRARLRQLLERARSGRSMVAVLGLIDDIPVATGLLHFLGPVCGLGTGSVLASHRGRGLQRALLAERIRIGFGRGSTRYVAFTENPASARNLELLGFRKVYDQLAWVRERTGGSDGMRDVGSAGASGG